MSLERHSTKATNLVRILCKQIEESSNEACGTRKCVTGRTEGGDDRYVPFSLNGHGKSVVSAFRT